MDQDFEFMAAGKIDVIVEKYLTLQVSETPVNCTRCLSL